MLLGPGQVNRLRRDLYHLTKNKDLEPIADELVDIWERLKADSPVYQKVERPITPANTVEWGN